MFNRVIRVIFLSILISFPCFIKAQSFIKASSYTNLDVLEENNGVAVADYDGDLDLDIFVVAKGRESTGNEIAKSRLFRNNNDGSFTDVTELSGLTDLFVLGVDLRETAEALDGWKYGVSWGDYNNDGFPDIFFTHAGKVQLFKNLGDGTFSEVTALAGILQNNGCINTGATWFDYNNDGHLDIFVVDWSGCSESYFYHNNGNETFTEMSVQLGINISNVSQSYMILPFDFNEDGWLDMYISNDFAQDNLLFINQSGSGFLEAAASFNLESEENANDMCISVSDFDLDGDFDFFTTGIDDNALFENNGNNLFSDVAQELGVLQTFWAWGSNFADFDLDGDEDLIIVNGYESDVERENFYYKNLTIEGGQIVFQKNTSLVGLADITMSTEATDFDYDNDGDLDVFITNTDRESYFYENKLINANETSSLNWFKIWLQGTTSNRDALGSKVIITTNAGVFKKYYSGLGFLSQSLQPVHFGLNENTELIELKIEWPSGLIETYQNLNSNQTIKAIEGQGFEILNITPSAKIPGCIDPSACTYNPNATISNPESCEYLMVNAIEGAINSGFNNLEIYTCNLSSEDTAMWSVEGGEIIDGQGTNQVSVKWGIEDKGVVNLIVNNTSCSSEQQSLEVALNIQNANLNYSVARIWNEALLEAIRNDFARPTVHARNLFHTAIAIYDSWAIIDKNAKPYLIGNTLNGFSNQLNDFIPNESDEDAQKKAISYAVYRLLNHRFIGQRNEETRNRFDVVMEQLGYEKDFTSVNYENGDAAALGNYIGNTLIAYGLEDKSNESFFYTNSYYIPVNPPLKLTDVDDPTGIINPNRWQPLSFRTFIDQSGNEIVGAVPPFLSPEWGNVYPFSLSEDKKLTYQRDGDTYQVYHDPSAPPKLSLDTNTSESELYKWNFSLVSLWSSHLDPTDGVMWDISPKTIGNIDIEEMPTDFEGHKDFYNLFDGGDISKGHQVNPKTNTPYDEQIVPRADYARVLAEFWADGPDSETPPGHWFTILNYVSDHPLFERKFNGEGQVLSELEWDVKSYFILGGAMHDSAIAAWGIKGWYDYIRPISAIRYMAELGQSTDENLPNYHIAGIPLTPGFIEQIEEGDPLIGENNENIGKIKVLAWRGHDFINDAKTDVAGVGWILAKNWWPYQRPSFVTPPFAGYVSGHSTFSRAAAEVMTLITGDEFFPGGLGEFIAKKDEFLVFEKGPSVDVKLQWATYRDASDQTSLSRIWGGIHPPADDIPGRLIGEEIGVDAFNFALPYFHGDLPEANSAETMIYPNPVIEGEVNISNTNGNETITMYDMTGRAIEINQKNYNEFSRITVLKLNSNISMGIYILQVDKTTKVVVINK